MADVPALRAFAERATELLVGIARENDLGLARAYDTLLFDVLRDVVRRRGASLAVGVSAEPIWLPKVRPADLDPIANDVTVAALERARRTADRFDPTRGDGASWALGAARFAYIDVVRDFYQVRRIGSTESVDPADLDEFASARQAESSAEEIAMTRAALEAALAALSAEERFVVLARAQYGMSYREIATYLYSNPNDTKKIDLILQRARRKLGDEEQRWNGSGA